MRHRSSHVLWAVVFLAMLVMASPPAYGQGAGVSTSLSGLVVDTSGGVMPGVDVVAKNNATGGTSQTVTDGGGRFTIPALPPGTYTVTLSLTGFKTVVLPDVQLVAATPQSVKVTLELGKIEETVVVLGAAEIVQTQTAAVQATIVVQQIQQLPLVTRTALDYVVNLPGVSTPNSGATRSSSLMGLPGYTNNITLDGVNVQSNDNKEGFFMYIRPLMDSVEEITVSTSTPGAESSGQGATQIRMVTRSGSNRLSGSLYNTWRNQAGTNDADKLARTKHPGWIWRLNTPYWFNKRDIPKTAAGDYFINDLRLQTPGFRVGGPILKDKLFYFFNWEWFLWPNQATRNRYLLNPQAQQGIFAYTANDGTTRTINVLTLAASKGQVSTIDPVVAKLLADIRSSTEQGLGGVSTYDLNVERFTYSPEGSQYRHFPTLRLDYNVTAAHRLTFTTRFNRFKSSPDVLNGNEPLWPGFPNQAGQYSKRFMAQGTLRSTFGKNLVNEVRIGYAGAFEGGTQFGLPSEVNESGFNCSGLGCQSVGGRGYSLGIGNAASGITGATVSTGPSRDYQPSRVYEDTLTWLKGKHSLSMGASFTNVRTIEWADTVVPSITLSLSSLDPAYTHFTYTSGNYPGGITSTQAGYAQGLYAVLTGRVTTISGTAYLDDATGKYVYLGERVALASMNDLGLFVSDSWRLRPNLTITGGLRYELQFPFKPDNSSYSRPQDWRMVYGLTGSGSGSLDQGNLFQPGTLTGTAPLLENYTEGASAYKTDLNNIAPSIGAAWRPSLRASFLTWLLSTDPVIRGGYSISYSRVGTDWFTGTYGTNPGRSRTATRSTTTGCNGACYIGFDGFPVLLRETHRLWAGTFPEEPTYPFSPAVNESIDEYHPNTRVPSTRQWSIGWQRELGKAMALEVRYVGNSNRGSIESYNINSSSNWNILENGFYDEFQLAQKNLQANIAAGQGNTFAYTGAPGTKQLPIFLAYFQGIPLNDNRNQNPANYVTSASSSACTATTPNYLACFKSSSWYNNLRMYNPSVTGIAGTGTSGLQNTAYASNAVKAGLPANFFQANPSIAQASSYLEANGGNTKYHALQIELRRRMSQGLLVQGSYHLVLSRSSWNYYSMREDWFYYNSGPSSHAIKFNWVFELPFGRGKPFGSGVSRWMDMLIGGWEFDGVGRIQSGSIFNYGGYRLVGMTEKDLQKMFKFYKRPDADGNTQLYMFPQDVIDNSILALYTASATSPTGYSGALPTGRYLAPASGPDCVSFVVKRNYIRCPGTTETRYIKGPWYWKVDMSFVKRIALVRNMRIEARMDLYNIFDVVNFNATSGMGQYVSNWRVTSAATDFNASQDPGGRITSFGLRFTW